VNTGRPVDLGAPLDPRQLARIEHVHRGFFYQHLYAARALLGLRGHMAELVVENDEDIEVLWPDRRAYVQVKFRSGGLGRADLTSIMARFDAIRVEHATGRRAGKQTFVIATNAPPRLAPDEIAHLPADVHLSYPSGLAPEGLPVPSPDVDTAFAALESDAATVPLAGLLPQSLALKLVGFAHALASGARNHRIAASEISRLCEVIVEQLQSFPVPPTPYRPQCEEPDLLGGARVRIVSGFSGAGKTAWASINARSVADLAAIYFDVDGIPDAYIPMSLARELAARFIHDPLQRPQIIAGEVAGLDVLRAVVRRVATLQDPSPTLVLDNAHLVDASVIVSVARVLDPVRLVVLSQPSPSLALLEATLSTRIEILQGWDDDTIAREIVDCSAHADASAIRRLRLLTGALPLFVTTAARLAAASYNGNIAAVCTAIERGVTVERTAQDVLLGRFVQTLSPATQQTMALFGIAEIPLTRDEAITLTQVRAGDAATAAAHLRNLTSAHVVQLVSGGKLALHDAFRPLALSALAQLGAEETSRVRVTLRDIIVRSLTEGADIERLRLWMRLSADTGDIDTLTDAALDEIIHQVSGPDLVRSTLEEAVTSGSLESSKQFDALDALAFWDVQRGKGLQLARYVAEMTVIADAIHLEPRQRVSLASKQMLLAVAASDRAKMEAAYQRGLAVAPDNDDLRRILSHSRARGLLNLRANADAEIAAEALVTEYLDGFGLRLQDLFLTQPPELLAPR
jgi:hypothetical protein